MRFNEFSRRGEWQVKKLGELGEIVGGGTPSTTVKEYWGDNNDIIWLTPTEIMNKYIVDSERKITKAGLQNSSAKILPINTILITTRATIGYIGIAKKECSTNQGFHSLICGKSVLYEFMYYLLQLFNTDMIRLANGSTFLEISSRDLKNMQIYIPTIPEQKKIADCLSSIDEQIEMEVLSIEKLKEHKQGLMQKLFPKVV